MVKEKYKRCTDGVLDKDRRKKNGCELKEKRSEKRQIKQEQMTELVMVFLYILVVDRLYEWTRPSNP